MNLIIYQMEKLLKLRADYASKGLDWPEFDNAIKQEQNTILRRIIRREYKNGKYLQHLKEIEDGQSVRIEKDRYWWITVNPYPSVCLNDIMYKVKTFIYRKMVSNYIYVYEQRGTTEQTCGNGKHVHLLIRKDKKTMPTVFKRDAKNSFKSITDVNNSSIFNIHNCPPEYLKDKYEYMLGGKTGDKKDIKCKWDIVFREKNKLNKIYFDSLEAFGLEAFPDTE